MGRQDPGPACSSASRLWRLARIEAGFLLPAVRLPSRPRRCSGPTARTPYELRARLAGLAAGTKARIFNGRRAALDLSKEPPRRKLVASRSARTSPRHNALSTTRRPSEVGMSPSALWSPTLQRNIAYALARRAYGPVGDRRPLRSRSICRRNPLAVRMARLPAWSTSRSCATLAARRHPRRFLRNRAIRPGRGNAAHRAPKHRKTRAACPASAYAGRARLRHAPLRRGDVFLLARQARRRPARSLPHLHAIWIPRIPKPWPPSRLSPDGIGNKKGRSAANAPAPSIVLSHYDLRLVQTFSPQVLGRGEQFSERPQPVIVLLGVLTAGSALRSSLRTARTRPPRWEVARCSSMRSPPIPATSSS